MNIFDFSIKEAQDIVYQLKTDYDQGLNNQEAKERQQIYGPNRLDLHKTSSWQIFGRQFKSSFIYLLITAMIVTIVLGEYIDTVMIFIFIAINTVLGFFQEYSSEKTVQMLNKLSSSHSKVVRGGQVVNVTTEQLVPGDIVILETGSKVPADIRIVEEKDLVIDESILTGESVSVHKQIITLDSVPQGHHQASNLAFSGTSIMKGWAKGIVLATGLESSFGKIAKLTSETKKISEFEKGISRFAHLIMKLVGVTLLLVLIAHLAIKQGQISFFDLIVFSVALTVSVVPEALPLVTTFSLARGARQMAKKNVIVKRLSAIEDLGGVEVLCSDKTGTLTENKLKITNFYADDYEQLIYLANLATAFELEEKIEPFDIALEAGLSVGQIKVIKQASKVAERPFDPREKVNLTLVDDQGSRVMIIRGAPETVIKHCQHLNSKQQKEIIKWIANEGYLGHRVIAVAHQQMDIDEEFSSWKEIINNNFIFDGVISFVDPIKESTFTAVEEAKKLGVRVVVITGDSKEVSGAVAYKIGITDSPKQVIMGHEWEVANKAQRKEYLASGVVFARISPEQKFSIINAMREYFNIGFLGDGINDAPALKGAGVSLVVDGAADIAREAADIILLKPDLLVIIEGIKHGRRVFANTTKYIKSTLSSNFGNFFAIATASLMIDYLPMLPIQILLVNLLTDTPMIGISTDNVDDRELTAPQRYQVKDITTVAIILGATSALFDFLIFAIYFNAAPEVLRTNWFVGSILTEIALLFSIRTNSFFIKTIRPSKTIIWVSLIVTAATVALPFTKLGQGVFQLTALQLPHLITILVVVVIYFIVSETVKLAYYQNNLKQVVIN